ncbi:hypothetical protein Taro_022886 [Colocasia esculenta]|uniref:Uncharacterized protein n=1 Tax=Colocasia esculenta TaxID=4460 RepID=A0A843VCS4_COLES|nr:hypothetical protein [Colocasia esculenta]
MPFSVAKNLLGAYGDVDHQSGETQVASSPPYFCSSPPSRSTNPLVFDARFGDEKSAPLTTLPMLATSPSAAAPRMGGCVRTKFGPKPTSVRTTGTAAAASLPCPDPPPTRLPPLALALGATHLPATFGRHRRWGKLHGSAGELRWVAWEATDPVGEEAPSFALASHPQQPQPPTLHPLPLPGIRNFLAKLSISYRVHGCFPVHANLVFQVYMEGGYNELYQIIYLYK